MTAVVSATTSAASHEAPTVLLPYQQRWLADTSPLKIIEKSRRTGLTWAEASDDVLIAAAAKTAGGQNVYYIAYNQDMTIEYVQACALWARAFNYAAAEVEEGLWDSDDDDKHIKTYTIRFPDSGHRIVALTSRPSNLRGRQGVVVIDEAAFHDQLGELLKAALALLIWGGSVRIISTHNGEQNAFNELVQEIRAGKRKGSVQRITFREAVADGLFRRVCLRTGKPWTADAEADWVAGVYEFYGDGAKEELDCVPSQGGGAVLTRALIEARMVERPVLRWQPPEGFTFWPTALREAETLDWCERHLRPLLLALNPNERHAFGEDFGRSGDLTVVAPYAITSSLQRVVPFLVELRNTPFEQQRQILFYLVDRLPRFFHGCLDARGNGQYLAEVAAQKYGSLRISQVMLSDAWYREQMPAFKAAFEDDTISLPRDADIADDLRQLKTLNGVIKLGSERTAGSSGQRHGDAAIALALGYTATRQTPTEIDWTPAPRRRDDSNDNDDRPVRSAGAW